MSNPTNNETITRSHEYFHSACTDSGYLGQRPYMVSRPCKCTATRQITIQAPVRTKSRLSGRVSVAVLFTAWALGLGSTIISVAAKPVEIQAEKEVKRLPRKGQTYSRQWGKIVTNSSAWVQDRAQYRYKPLAKLQAAISHHEIAERDEYDSNGLYSRDGADLACNSKVAKPRRQVIRQGKVRKIYVSKVVRMPATAQMRKEVVNWLMRAKEHGVTSTGIQQWLTHSPVEPIIHAKALRQGRSHTPIQEVAGTFKFSESCKAYMRAVAVSPMLAKATKKASPDKSLAGVIPSYAKGDYLS